MLGVKTYEKSFIDSSRTATNARIDAFDSLKNPGEFESVYFNTMVLALDRLFVHRLRGVEGKDGNALNEVRVLTDSIVDNGGVMAAESQIKFKQGSVLGYEPGDSIALSADDFRRLSAAFFDEIEARFS
jgi:hypothetical protein